MFMVHICRHCRARGLAASPNVDEEADRGTGSAGDHPGTEGDLGSHAGRQLYASTQSRRTRLCFVSKKSWFVSNEESMVQGTRAGWILVVSTAITPDRATEMWQAGTKGGDGWADAPELEVHRGARA
jgi:hypothetical protein